MPVHNEKLTALLEWFETKGSHNVVRHSHAATKASELGVSIDSLAVMTALSDAGWCYVGGTSPLFVR